MMYLMLCFRITDTIVKSLMRTWLSLMRSLLINVYETDCLNLLLYLKVSAFFLDLWGQMGDGVMVMRRLGFDGKYLLDN